MPTSRPLTPGSGSVTARPSTPGSRSSLHGSTPDVTPREGMSPQQRQAIAIGGLVLCLVVGAGIVYWLLFGTSPKHRTITIDPKQQTVDMNNRNAMRMQQQRRPQSIVKVDDSTWRASATGSVMVIRTQGNGGYGIALNHDRRDFLNPQQAAMVSGITRAGIDQAMAAEWGISPEQVGQLKKLRLSWAIAVTEPEREEMRQLWNTYIKATDGTAKIEAEKAVIKRLDDLAKAHLEDSRKVFATKLDEVKKILTPQQVEKISQR